MHTSISLHIAHPAEMSVRVHRSTIDDQGIVTTIQIGPGCRIDGYEGYGVAPSDLSARLRELADELDAAAAAMTPNQGTNCETVRTEGDAHWPAPAANVSDGADSHDVGGVPVETVPVLRGDVPGAGPVTAPTEGAVA